MSELSQTNIISVPEVTPDPEELSALKAYFAGNPDFQPVFSHDDVLKELGLGKEE